MTDPKLLHALWQSAVDAEYGVTISTSDRPLLRNYLYAYRSSLGTNQFAEISIVFAAKDNELVLIRRDADGKPSRRTAD